MRRRGTPYSKLSEVREGRGDLLALILVTIFLGVLLGLLTDALYDWLLARLTDVALQHLLFWSGTLAAALLGLGIVWIFYGLAESERVEMEILIPYHIFRNDHGQRRLTVAHQPAYQVAKYARQLVRGHYQDGSQQLQELMMNWDQGRADGQQFKQVARQPHADLTQCLLLLVLQRYGKASIGPEAPYGPFQSSLPAAEWSLEELPAPLNSNPFLLAQKLPDSWRLLLPEDVTLHLTEESNSAWRRWELCHRRYGRMRIHWSPYVAVMGKGSQPWRVLTDRLRPSDGSETHILSARFFAQAHFRWALWKGSDPFHQWATGLLARLEEALDFGYFLQTRPNRILADLDWKVGWVETGDSLVDALARIEARLEALEMGGLE